MAILEKEHFETLRSIAREAGSAVMAVYAEEDFGIQHKEDRSPLTRADCASHEIITRRLKKSFPEIPVLSEEGADIPVEVRRDWFRFWCVDPLDGTKEFIRRNGEFTVNIALIENGVSVAGVIFAPALDIMYWGGAGIGAFKRLNDRDPEPIHTAKRTRSLRAARSRSHAAPEERDLLQEYDITEWIGIGSSLKFCLIAEGSADLYYRHGPTMEWDTAAGQALVEAAGGRVTAPDGSAFTYNKPVLTNGPFLVQGH